MNAEDNVVSGAWTYQAPAVTGREAISGRLDVVPRKSEDDTDSDGS